MSLSKALNQASAAAARGALLMIVGPLWLMASPTVQAHEGGFGNAVMWQACEAKKIKDPCSFENLDRDVYRGTCQSMSDALVCVRNQPIAYAPGSPHALEHAKAPRADSKLSRWWPWLVGGLVLLVGGLAVFRGKKRIP